MSKLCVEGLKKLFDWFGFFSCILLVCIAFFFFFKLVLAIYMYMCV